MRFSPRSVNWRSSTGLGAPSMGDDALVVRFDGPAADGYSGQYLTANGYVSREILALTLPVRSTPALVLGSLRSVRYFTDVQI